MIDGVWKIISGVFGGIFQIFNVVNYVKQFSMYKDGFSVLDWIFSVLAFILVLAIWAVIIYMLVLLIRKYIRFRRSAVGSEDLLEEVAELHRDVIKLNREKERILALKIGQTDVPLDMLNSIYEEEEGEEKALEEVEEGLLPRFSKLEAIDQKYLYYSAPEFRRDYTLEEICAEFRNFACSRMGLFYEPKVIRLLRSFRFSPLGVTVPSSSVTLTNSLRNSTRPTFSEEFTRHRISTTLT